MLSDYFNYFHYQRHEPDPALRLEHCLSFEGFARYLMDKDNYAFIPEKTKLNADPRYEFSYEKYV